MQKFAAALLAMLLFVGPAASAPAPEDAYVACVVGYSVVGMNNGLKVDDARAAADTTCEPLYPLKAGDEEDGLSDFLYHLIWDISESSMLPPQPADDTPLDIGTGY